MSIEQLTEEQIRDWTLEQKDTWWLKNIYRGSLPQLNMRSALTGMILGGLLSLTNLYVGIKTGWTLGVGVSSVILSFAIFKFFSRMGWGKEMTILENNAMQSIATSAGYMTAPLMASMPAYMLVTGQVVPMWQTYFWICTLAVLGVLFAFPLKRRFINDEQLPFPEGYAAAIVLEGLHSDLKSEGIFKSKILAWGASGAALIELLRSEKIMEKIKLPFFNIPEYWDLLIYKYFTPRIWGTPLKDLTIHWDSSVVILGTGGLMGMRTALSMLLGAVINYMILAPLLIKNGIIVGTGLKNISLWALWGGTAIMTTSSLYAFFSKPEVIVSAFTRLFSKKSKATAQAHQDVLAKIELPISVFVIGIPTVGAACVLMGHYWFGIHYWLGILAIPLIFVFTLIAVNATGLTAITPGSALAKLTQVTYSVVAPGNMATNLMTAGMTSEISLNASNLLMDIKPGYMLGAKPRQQAVGHVLGIFAGGLVAVPVFYSLFNGDLSKLTSESLPLPSTVVWKAVAEVLNHGISSLHPTAQIWLLVGALLGVVIEFFNQKFPSRFPLSGVGLGLGFILDFTSSWMMALGAILFWLLKVYCKDPKTNLHRIFVDNRETLSAGLIAGGSIIGLLILLLEMNL